MDVDNINDDQEMDAVWEEIKAAFGLEEYKDCVLKQVSENAIEYLTSQNLYVGVLEYLQAEVEKRLRISVAPYFWKHFHQQYLSDDTETSANRFHTAVNELFVSIAALQPMVAKMDLLAIQCNYKVNQFGRFSYQDLFWLFLKGTLYSQLPGSHYRQPIKAFYSRAFHVHHVTKYGNNRHDSSMDQDEDEDENVQCEGCKKDMSAPSQCVCTSIMANFTDVNKKLLEIKLLDRLAGDIVTGLVRQQIEKHVADTCNGSFTESKVNSLKVWLNSVVMGWIRNIYSADTGGITCSTNKEVNDAIISFDQRLSHFLFETYTKARIDQLYNIIIEFPDSQPAIIDLRDCLEKTDLRPFLTKTLKKVLETKLLHLGVNTTDILTAYIAAIRALRVLDPSGVLLEIVCEPVRKYLRTRDDTVRCIVQSLIDDNTNELADELIRNEGLCLDDSFMADDLNDPEELEETWDTWMPDPVDADPTKLSHPRKRASDIISMLVNIYGSKELFVNEYRTLLSNRILSQYDPEREIRNLELLKLRFGEAPLHQCEVMLKDLSDSKRMNTNIHNEDQQTTPNINFKDWRVEAIIVSAQFWPQFKTETLELPENITKGLEAYTKAFEAVKGNRTLVWKPHLGNTNIDLEIGDKKINLTVSPIHAAIIYQFQVKAEWTVDELAQTLKVPPSTLRRRISFWQTQGLIHEASTDVFKLIEEGPMRRMSGVSGSLESGHDLDDESESVTRTSQDQRVEELSVFWKFIENMLINLESLPLDRIFQMLKMFAMQGPSAVECDIEELRSFLDEKVRQHELLFSAGQYKLPKS